MAARVFAVAWGFVVFFLGVLPTGATARLFPEGLSEREWATFSAIGFSEPVTGIIYRGGTMWPGMPLGGLGTGFISLGTDGTLDYANTIFNTYLDRAYIESPPRKGPIGEVKNLPSVRLPFLGISIAGKTTVLSLKRIEGLANAKNIDYWGHYPVADLNYHLNEPLDVSLRAWTPFLPSDADGSNTPGLVFEVHLHNKESRTQKGTLVFSFSGPRINGVPSPNDNLVGVRRQLIEGELTGVAVRGRRKGLDRSYALGIIGIHQGVRTGRDLGEEAEAWNNVDRTLQVAAEDAVGSSVAIDFSLKPGKDKIVRFILAWYAPEWRSTHFGWWTTFTPVFPKLSMSGEKYINMYSTRFNSAVDVAKYLAKEHDSILSRVLAWQQAIYSEKMLPGWLQDGLINVTALLAQNSFLVKSPDPNHWWGEKAFFCVNEGLMSCPQQACIANDEFGEWVVNMLFPELALRKLEAFKHYQKKDTGQTPSTLGAGSEPDRPWYGQQLALDGQAYIHMVDRYRLCTGDDRMLDEWYPSVKAGLKFMFTIDKDGDGIPDAHGNNHYLDSWPMEGAAPHIASYWLSTLAIVERMAALQGDSTFASECKSWYTNASQSLETKLWNDKVGSYLLYNDTKTGKKSDTVCVEQLVGEMFAHVHGLPGVLPPERVGKVLSTLEQLNVAGTKYGIRLALRPDGSADRTINAPGGVDELSIPSYSTLTPAMVMMWSGNPRLQQLGLEIVRRTWHNQLARMDLTWAMPCSLDMHSTAKESRGLGLEYYHNSMLWVFPTAVLNQDIKTICAPGGLIGRVRKSGQGRNTNKPAVVR